MVKATDFPFTTQISPAIVQRGKDNGRGIPKDVEMTLEEAEELANTLLTTVSKVKAEFSNEIK